MKDDGESQPRLHLINVTKERMPKGVLPFTLLVESEQRASVSSPTTFSPTSRSPFLEEVFPCECRFSEGNTLENNLFKLSYYRCARS